MLLILDRCSKLEHREQPNQLSPDHHHHHCSHHHHHHHIHIHPDHHHHNSIHHPAPHHHHHVFLPQCAVHKHNVLPDNLNHNMNPINQYPLPQSPQFPVSASLHTNLSPTSFGDSQDGVEEVEDDGDEDPVFVLTDEWKEFFAKSDAKRREAKKLARKQGKK